MPAPPPSLLDFTQILQRVFDEAQGKLRVDSTATVVAGSIECIIDQSTDSIRVGDGTDTLAVNSDGSINVVVSGAVATNTLPFLQNQTLMVSGTEYTINIPNNTQHLVIRPRLGTLKIAYSAGQSGTTYFTVNRGSAYVIDSLKTNNLTLYVQSSVNNDIVEVHGFYVA